MKSRVLQNVTRKVKITFLLLLLMLLSRYCCFSLVWVFCVRPHRQPSTRLPRPWDSPGKNTGVVCHFLLQCVKVKSLRRVHLLATPWTAAYQAPPSMGFSRQEYWSGLPLPSLNIFAKVYYFSPFHLIFNAAFVLVVTGSYQPWNYLRKSAKKMDNSSHVLPNETLQN